VDNPNKTKPGTAEAAEGGILKRVLNKVGFTPNTKAVGLGLLCPFD